MVLKDFIKVQRSVKKAYDAHFITIGNKYKLTKLEIDVLLFLENNKSLDTARDIVNIRELSKSHVSQSIETLTQKNYITRIVDVEDKRIIHLKITQKAYDEVVPTLVKYQREFFKSIFSDIDETELEIFRKILNKIYNNTQKVTKDE